MSTQQYPFHLLHLDFETLSFYFTTHHIQLMRLLTERKLVLASLQHQLSKFFTRLIDCQSARCKICTFCSLCANCVQTVCKLCKLVFWNSVLRMFFLFFFYPFCTVQFAPHTTLGAKMMRGLIRQGFSSFPIFVTPQLSRTINSPLYSDFHLHLRDRDRPAQLGCNQNLISGHF